MAVIFFEEGDVEVIVPWGESYMFNQSFLISSSLHIADKGIKVLTNSVTFNTGLLELFLE